MHSINNLILFLEIVVFDSAKHVPPLQVPFHFEVAGFLPLEVGGVGAVHNSASVVDLIHHGLVVEVSLVLVKRTAGLEVLPLKEIPVPYEPRGFELDTVSVKFLLRFRGKVLFVHAGVFQLVDLEHAVAGVLPPVDSVDDFHFGVGGLAAANGWVVALRLVFVLLEILLLETQVLVVGLVEHLLFLLFKVALGSVDVLAAPFKDGSALALDSARSRNRIDELQIILDQLILQNLIDTRPLSLIQLEYFQSQVLNQRMDVVVEVNLAVVDFLNHIVHVLSAEGGLVMKQLVQKDAERPYVGFLGLRLAKQDLRRHVLVGSAKGLAHFIRIVHGAPPEVAELDVEVFVQEDVLRFQVAMHDVPAMDVLQGQRRLIKELHLLQLGNVPLVLVEIAEEIAVLGILKEKVESAVLFDEILELDDVGMIEPHV